MNKGLLLSAVFFIKTATAAALPTNTELPCTSTIEDAESLARTAIISEYERSIKQTITHNEQTLFQIIFKEISAIGERCGDNMSEERITLDWIRSCLHTRPELEFCARFQYLAVTYNIPTYTLTEMKSKYMAYYRHTLDLIKLIGDYDQIQDSDFKQRFCSALYDASLRFIEESKERVLQEGSLYSKIDTEEFFETHKILESERKALSTANRSEEAFARLNYIHKGIEIQKLIGSDGDYDDRAIALFKECSELPVPRELRFSMKTGYLLLLHGKDLSKELQESDLKGHFIKRYTLLKELREQMLEYQTLKDSPEITSNPDLIDALVSTYETSKSRLFDNSQQYLSKKPIEYFNTLVEFPDIRTMIFQLILGN